MVNTVIIIGEIMNNNKPCFKAKWDLGFGTDFGNTSIAKENAVLEALGMEMRLGVKRIVFTADKKLVGPKGIMTVSPENLEPLNNAARELLDSGMKYKQKSYFEVSSNEIDKAIKKHYGRDFNCRTNEEWQFGSYYSRNINKEPLEKYDQGYVDLFRTGKEEKYIVHYLLHDMCVAGVIESGEYLIRVEALDDHWFGDF
jgi:hypothetical protein